MKHAYLLYTGYGKTKLCLDKIMQAKRRPKTLLISTKNIVESAWTAEIQKWYPGKLSYQFITGNVKEDERLNRIQTQPDIFGLNTDMLDWYITHTCSIKRYVYVKKSKEYPTGKKPVYDTSELVDRFDLIIFDEVSLFKNSQSERFKAVKAWAHKVPNVMILSATPTPKNIEDLWAEIYLLDGGQRLGKNITEFRETYAIPVPLPNGMNRYQYSQQAVDEVLRLVKDITTSIPKPDQPLFPEPIIKKIMIKPDDATATLLKQFKDDFIIQLNNGKSLVAMSKNQLILKINQIASGDVYYQKQAVHMNDIKFKALQYLISNIVTPVLIVYTYVFDKDKLLTLPGAQLLDNPQAFQDWNDNKIKIGILSPFSAAHGLNLQDSECRNIFWFSPIWDTEKWIQTNARVARRGQRYSVTISVLLLKDSYDAYAFDLCQDKFRIQFNNLEKLR
jgi:SNF2 family DNA or RNA helicase